MPKVIPVEEMIGRRYGWLVVKSFHSIKWYGKTKRKFFNCVCDCGAETVSGMTGMRRGGIKSCGCYSPTVTTARNTSHGDSHSQEYKLWLGIKSRCVYEGVAKKSGNYHNYMGRGIQMCREWADSYTAFLGYVGRRPSPLHSIDRIDNNGNYEPGNVRWATVLEQMNNTRSNRNLTFNEKTQSLKQWSRETGINYSTLYERIVILDWSVGDALTAMPKRKYYAPTENRK